jgi:hypothetical protein
MSTPNFYCVRLLTKLFEEKKTSPHLKTQLIIGTYVEDSDRQSCSSSDSQSPAPPRHAAARTLHGMGRWVSTGRTTPGLWTITRYGSLSSMHGGSWRRRWPVYRHDRRGML